MNVAQEIANYITSLPEAKRANMRELHERILATLPDCELWFLDGKNEEGKVVSNPNIGYGKHTIEYAGGKSREFYTIGLSANTTGISIYILGIEDKKYLADTYARDLGKATITGYCIKFRKLTDINVDVLLTAVKDGWERNR